MSAQRQFSLSSGFVAGLAGSLVMILVMALLRFTTNTISIPELMEESVIRLTGGRIEAFLINALGVGGKALLLVSITEGTLLVGGLLGLLFTRLWPVMVFVRSRLLSGLLFGLLVGLALNLIFLPAVGQGFFGSEAFTVTAPPDIARSLYGTNIAPFGLPVYLAMFLLSLVFGLALVSFVQVNPAMSRNSNPSPAGAPIARRTLFNAFGGVLLALFGGGLLWAAIRAMLAPPPVAAVQPVELAANPATPAPASNLVLESTPFVPPGSTTVAEPFAGVKPKLVPEITPVESFYITTKNFIDPVLDVHSWQLSFKGMVDHPFSISYNELQALPAIERVETLACISNPVGGDLIGNARWKGVLLADLLERAKLQAGVIDLVLRAGDGYADSIPLKVAQENECLLAYEMNGQPLVQKHGYPVRLLVPGIYGMKNVKWITEIESVNRDYRGYWESQGWSDTATYQTMARIDYPNQTSIPADPLYISGIAFAGDRGIKRVEVSIDGGRSWNDATLRPLLDKYAWVLWTYPWQPTPGLATIIARATDNTGELQTNHITDTYPDGATGLHIVRVIVS